MKNAIIVLGSILLSTFIFSQETVNVSGGGFTNSSGSISYSIGQIFFQDISNSSGSINEGVQQAYDISTLSLESNLVKLSLVVYPNPTQSRLSLRVGNFNYENLSYNLLDLEGKVLERVVVKSEESIIDMQQFPIATYLVEVYKDDKKVQTFKIIKNHE